MSQNKLDSGTVNYLSQYGYVSRATQNESVLFHEQSNTASASGGTAVSILALNTTARAFSCTLGGLLSMI